MCGSTRRTWSRSNSKDLEDIQAQARYISYISPSVNSSGQAIFGANNTPTTVYGISPEYLDIRRYKVEDGDIFSEQDVKTAAKVCLVGKSVVDELFPDGESPVGKVIRFGKIPLRIVGVLESKGYNSMGMDQDDLILAPTPQFRSESSPSPTCNRSPARH